MQLLLDSAARATLLSDKAWGLSMLLNFVPRLSGSTRCPAVPKVSGSSHYLISVSISIIKLDAKIAS